LLSKNIHRKRISDREKEWLCNWNSLRAPVRSGSEDRKFWTFGTIKEAHEKYQEDALKAQLPRRSITFFSIFAYRMGVKKLRFDNFICPICAAGLHKEPVLLLEKHK
jgi:chromosome segregation and condensation protein ScpB